MVVATPADWPPISKVLLIKEPETDGVPAEETSLKEFLFPAVAPVATSTASHRVLVPETASARFTKLTSWLVEFRLLPEVKRVAPSYK